MKVKKSKRNHSQLKWEILWKNKNETDFTSISSEFKKEVIQIWKELRKIINRNAHHCNKEINTIKKNQSKLDNSIAKVKANLEAMNNRLNNAEEWIINLEDRIMEITQSEQQTEDEWKKKVKARDEIYGVI